MGASEDPILVQVLRENANLITVNNGYASNNGFFATSETHVDDPNTQRLGELLHFFMAFDYGLLANYGRLSSSGISPLRYRIAKVAWLPQ
ncbi:hypothetical protein SLS58_004577 [Diplodia intermedia]|uniref:Uncharacterized protein n=1 Tax=Diplodia intermedia TaxID=856260 RepID=A0ABR3TSZ8_9PEZI